MKNIVKAFALIIAVTLAFFVVFVTCEADHDCTNENCAICAVIQIVNDLFKFAMPLLLTNVAIIVNACFNSYFNSFISFKKTTDLITLKSKQTA